MTQIKRSAGQSAVASAAYRAGEMNRILWSLPVPILMTSGTMAVGNNFSRFKAEMFLDACDRLAESVSSSPFNYDRNCIIYIPHYVPTFKKENSADYYEDISYDISELISVSNGHALVLFNSYSAMSAISEQLKDYNIAQPIFVLNRNNPHTLEEFKNSGNGILLATGAAWEGMDFPGDIVSMLIIPRLPFPIPDAFSEHERKKYNSLKEFIEAVALPDMQIKLRQGIGRAIRLETDTCVIAILDDRAQRQRSYHNAVKQALPTMPMTGNIEKLEKFYHSVKTNEYF